MPGYRLGNVVEHSLSSFEQVAGRGTRDAVVDVAPLLSAFNTRNSLEACQIAAGRAGRQLYGHGYLTRGQFTRT
jgi:hypothetical protein